MSASSSATGEWPRLLPLVFDPAVWLGLCPRLRIYHQFAGDEGTLHIDFSVFMLFIGVATAITAFPVLCRILTELKLLETPVGVIVLSAGVANDVVGWILLALCVALVNAGSCLTALWILLACLGYMLVLVYAIRPPLTWLLRRTESIEAGPSQSIISLILLLALASAFFTDVIGVLAIFGGFMVGLILPRDGGFNVKVTEKLEDMIGAIFLPLYFTLSGLNTNLGLLDNGMTWAYVIAVTLVAFFTKLTGASAAAWLNGLVWRESFTIGVLMSCKGLVELVVLNIGLQAKILSTRTFTIFVVMALLTTFATTPLASYLYPPWYQKKLDAWKRGEIDWETGVSLTPHDDAGDESKLDKQPSNRVRRMLVYLRLNSLPATLDFVSLFGIPSSTGGESHVHPSENDKRASVTPMESAKRKKAVRAHGFRLLQLTDRDSSVMTVSQVNDYSRHDPVVNSFRTVGQFYNVAASGEAAVVPDHRFAEALVSKASDISSNLLVVPWGETGSLVDALGPSPDNTYDKFAPAYTNFVNAVLQSTNNNVAVFFTRDSDATPASAQASEGPKLARTYSFRDIHHDLPIISTKNKSHHIFLPYFGGKDDDAALKPVLQLCEKHDVTATVVHFSEPSGSSSTQDDYFNSFSAHVPTQIARRIGFKTVSDGNTAEAVVDYAASEIRTESLDMAWYTLIILGRRASAKSVEGKLSHRASDDVQKCLGSMAGHLIASRLEADLLVVQAKV